MTLVNTEEEAKKLLRRLDTVDEIVYDSETSGLEWQKNHIVGHVLTFGPKDEDSFYVPVRHASAGNLTGCTVPATEDGWDGTLHWFEEELIKKLNKISYICGHNLSFDLKFLYRIGFKALRQRFEDTMINCFLIDEIRKSLSLEDCCKQEGVVEKRGQPLYDYIAEKIEGVAADKKSMGHYWKLDPRDHIVHDYASGDGVSTYQLRDVSREKINQVYHTNPDGRELTMKKVWDIECRLIPVLHRMEMRGIKIDVNAMEKLYEEISGEYQSAFNAIGQINVRSPNAMKDLFASRGITDWPTTAKGSPSFREEWLMQSDIGQMVVKTRKFRNLMSSFLDPINERFLYNGRIHAEYHQTRDENFGTKTGRLSCTKPNLTAQPGKRQGELGKRFREIYVPDTGKQWVSADFSNCEIRIAAHYCMAAAWVNGFVARPPIDPHTSVANAIGISRQHAKTINLGLMTGMGKKALAEDLGLSLSEGSKVVDQFFDGLPELKKFQNNAKFNFKKRRFVSTLLDRRLQLDDARFAYKAVNRLTQGGNADIIKTKMVEIDEEFLFDDSLDLLINIHDDLNWQSSDEGKDNQVGEIMCDVDNEYIKMRVPMKTDIGRGKNWSEATFYED